MHLFSSTNALPLRFCGIIEMEARMPDYLPNAEPFFLPRQSRRLSPHSRIHRHALRNARAWRAARRPRLHGFGSCARGPRHLPRRPASDPLARLVRKLRISPPSRKRSARCPRARALHPIARRPCDRARFDHPIPHAAWLYRKRNGLAGKERTSRSGRLCERAGLCLHT